MLKLLEKLTSISREKGVRIEIYFNKCKGRLLIDKEVKALDEYGNVAPWGRAFPGISIQNVFDQCRVKKVVVYKGSERMLEGEDLESVVRELSSYGRYT